MKTEEESIQADHVRVLGEEAGRYYNHLYRQLVLMHVILRELRMLLRILTGEIDVDASLRKRFFRMIWGSYGRDLIHGISALADPAEDGHFNNISLKGLMTMLGKRGVVSCAFKQALIEFNEVAAPVGTYRNKHLAHFDAKTILRLPTSDVTTTLDQIAECLTKAAAVLNTVEREHFKNSCVIYTKPWVPPGGIETVISMLELYEKYVAGLLAVEKPKRKKKA